MIPRAGGNKRRGDREGRRKSAEETDSPRDSVLDNG